MNPKERKAFAKSSAKTQEELMKKGVDPDTAQIQGEKAALKDTAPEKAPMLDDIDAAVEKSLPPDQKNSTAKIAESEVKDEETKKDIETANGDVTGDAKTQKEHAAEEKERKQQLREEKRAQAAAEKQELAQRKQEEKAARDEEKRQMKEQQQEEKDARAEEKRQLKEQQQEEKDARAEEKRQLREQKKAEKEALKEEKRLEKEAREEEKRQLKEDEKAQKLADKEALHEEGMPEDAAGEALTEEGEVIPEEIEEETPEEMAEEGSEESEVVQEETEEETPEEMAEEGSEEGEVVPEETEEETPEEMVEEGSEEGEVVPEETEEEIPEGMAEAIPEEGNVEEAPVDELDGVPEAQPTSEVQGDTMSTEGSSEQTKNLPEHINAMPTSTEHNVAPQEGVAISGPKNPPLERRGHPKPERRFEEDTETTDSDYTEDTARHSPNPATLDPFRKS
ncbi:MAG: hypothetical protein KVP17_004029 [Porospora cf. gigantea B]|nr:MAG: hypothetical protein KVP17_004029 [Porospora cf. gigantea B]